MCVCMHCARVINKLGRSRNQREEADLVLPERRIDARAISCSFALAARRMCIHLRKRIHAQTHGRSFRASNQRQIYMASKYRVENSARFHQEEFKKLGS